MRVLTLALLLVLAVQARKKTVEEEIKELDFSNVHFVNDGDFDKTLFSGGGANSDWGVFFYDPTCNHCRKLIVTWVGISHRLANLTDDEPKPRLAAVNCKETGLDTCERFGVDGFPYVVVISKGIVKKFSYDVNNAELLY